MKIIDKLKRIFGYGEVIDFSNIKYENHKKYIDTPKNEQSIPHKMVSKGFPNINIVGKSGDYDEIKNLIIERECNYYKAGDAFIYCVDLNDEYRRHELIVYDGETWFNAGVINPELKL